MAQQDVEDTELLLKESMIKVIRDLTSEGQKLEDVITHDVLQTHPEILWHELISIDWNEH